MQNLIQMRWDVEDISDQVHTREQEHLGTIEQVVMDPRTGRLHYAMIALEDSARTLLIPWSSLRLDAKKKVFRTNLRARSLRDFGENVAKVNGHDQDGGQDEDPVIREA